MTASPLHRGPASSVPRAASQTRASPKLTVAILVPSGLHATRSTPCSCWNGPTSSRPVAASQTRAVPSALAVATRVPFGLNAAPAFAFGSGPASSRPVAASQTRAVPSELAVTTWAPSGLNAALRTTPLVLEWNTDWQPGARVPDARGSIGAGGHHVPAVRTERRGLYRSRTVATRDLPVLVAHLEYECAQRLVVHSVDHRLNQMWRGAKRVVGVAQQRSSSLLLVEPELESRLLALVSRFLHCAMRRAR